MTKYRFFLVCKPVPEAAVMKKWLKFVFLSTCIAAASSVIAAATAQAQAKTKSPDSAKIYSPDHKSFAFVRTTTKTVDSAKGEVPADVVFLATNGDKEAHPLFKSGASLKTKGQGDGMPYGDIHDLCFSNDSRELYFLNAAFAVSDAVFAVDLKSKQLRYVIDANTLKVVRSGKWKGNLIVERHKYHDADQGGAYEVNCAVTPNGKELKQLDVVPY